VTLDWYNYTASSHAIAHKFHFSWYIWSMRKRLRLPLLALILVLALACGASTQLQPFLLKSLGAPDGSFGIRPMSHACAGLKLNGASIDWLPAADFLFNMGRFSVRYWVDEEPKPGRLVCVGQDIWFGE
jgi:hypothetical protein